MSLLSESELAVRAVSMRPQDLVLVRHHLEASEGLGFVIAKRGGAALLVAPVSQEEALDAFIADMKVEVRIHLGTLPEHEEAMHVAD